MPTAIQTTKALMPDDPMTEAGLIVMSVLMDKLVFYQADLKSTTDITSVHETRKTSRRMRTALRLFTPYFQKGLLKSYRKRFKKFMGHLGDSRDTAVFLLKMDMFLAGYINNGSPSATDLIDMEALRRHFQIQQELADARVRSYLSDGQFDSLLQEFAEFCQTPGNGALVNDDPISPILVCHMTPVIIYNKVAAVRAGGENLEFATPDQLHRLRIECKKLRYTLEFFEPVLGPAVSEVIESLKRILTYLGDLNDAQVHQQMLAEVREVQLLVAATEYGRTRAEQLDRLIDGFPQVWNEFNRPQWREQLASAVAVL